MDLIELFLYGKGAVIIDEDGRIFSGLKAGLLRRDIAERISMSIGDILFIDDKLNNSTTRIRIRRQDGTNGPAFIVQQNQGRVVNILLHDMRKSNSDLPYQERERRST